jgi:hypothetical protein
MQFHGVIKKLAVSTLVAWGSSFVVLLTVGWIVIFPLAPEHPQAAPRRLWNDLLSASVWFTPLLALIEMITLACAAHLMSRLRTPFLLIVAAAVPSLILVAALAFPAIVAFHTPVRAMGFFLAFVALTFAGLRVLLFFPITHEPKS